MTSCWASGFSLCGQGHSREHLVSQGIFDQKTIFVQGFEWCLNKEIEVGLSAVTSKILCRKHNSALEAVDRGGISVINAFENAAANTDTGILDGRLFERWLLKTAINLSYGSKLTLGVGMANAQFGIPPPYLLAVVFGQLAFTHKMGAYFLYPSHEFRFRKGEIMIVPVHKNGEIGGFYFHLRGFDVVLSLFPGHSLPTLGQLGLVNLPEYILEAQSRYRSTSIVTSTNGAPRHEVLFSWS